MVNVHLTDEVTGGLLNRDDMQAVAVCMQRQVQPWLDGNILLRAGKGLEIRVVVMQPNVPPVPSRYGFEIEGDENQIALFKNVLTTLCPDDPAKRVFAAAQHRYVIS